MDFIEMIKEELNEKYSDMLNNKTSAEKIDVSIESAQKFLNKFESLRSNVTTKEEKKEEAKNSLYPSKKENIFEYIAYSLPILLALVFGLILFINTKQIKIRFSFGVWCFLWVAFTIIAFLTTIILCRKQQDFYKDEAKNASVATVIIMTICLCIVLPFACKLKANFNPTKYLSFTATQKTVKASYSSYETKIVFSVKNESNLEINYVSGEMKFYDGDELVESISIYWNEKMLEGEIKTFTANITSYDDRLYKTQFENLGITYDIECMRFKGQSDEYYFDEEPIVIKEIVSAA